MRASSLEERAAYCTDAGARAQLADAFGLGGAAWGRRIQARSLALAEHEVAEGGAVIFLRNEV